MRGVTIDTAATSDPVTTAELKTHLRVTTSDEDTYLGELISKATAHLQSALGGVQWVNATFAWTLDEFPDWELRPPRSPLSSVSSIVYLDEGGDSQTLAASKYRVTTTTVPGRITPSFGESWPAPYDVTVRRRLRRHGCLGPRRREARDHAARRTLV